MREGDTEGFGGKGRGMRGGRRGRDSGIRVRVQRSMVGTNAGGGDRRQEQTARQDRREGAMESKHEEEKEEEETLFKKGWKNRTARERKAQG